MKKYANAVGFTSYTMFTATCCHSECCVLSGFDRLMTLLYIIVCPIIYIEDIKSL